MVLENVIVFILVSVTNQYVESINEFIDPIRNNISSQFIVMQHRFKLILKSMHFAYMHAESAVQFQHREFIQCIHMTAGQF